MWDVIITLFILIFLPPIVGVLMAFIIHWWLELRELERQMNGER